MDKTRRDFLKLAGGVTGVALLAACGVAPDPRELTLSNKSRFLYVDASNGNDDNEGTKQKPLKTLQAALSKAGASSHIQLRAGGYYSPFTQDKDGEVRYNPATVRRYGNSETNPMTIDRWGDASDPNPIIGGSFTLREEWGKVGEFYRKELPFKAYSLYIDGEEVPPTVYCPDCKGDPKSSDKPDPAWLEITEIDDTGDASTLMLAKGLPPGLERATARVRLKKFVEQADLKIESYSGRRVTLSGKLRTQGYDERDNGLRQRVRFEGLPSKPFEKCSGWCYKKENGRHFVYLNWHTSPQNLRVQAAVAKDLLILSDEQRPQHLTINNVSFAVAGRNAITSESAQGFENIRISGGCSFSRIGKAAIYLYGRSNDSASRIVVGSRSAGTTAANYMRFDRCGIMVLIARSYSCNLHFLKGTKIGLTGSEFNYVQAEGSLNEFNGAIVMTGFKRGASGDKPPCADGEIVCAGGVIEHIDLTDIGGNGVKYQGFEGTIRHIKGRKICQRLDDVALVYLWSRGSNAAQRRTENVTIRDVEGSDTGGTQDGWGYGEPDIDPFLRACVYVDNGVTNSKVSFVEAERCYKGVLVNNFTRNITVERSTIKNCAQGIVFNEEVSNGNPNHKLTRNNVSFGGDLSLGGANPFKVTPYAFVFERDNSKEITQASWDNNTSRGFNNRPAQVRVRGEGRRSYKLCDFLTTGLVRVIADATCSSASRVSTPGSSSVLSSFGDSSQTIL